MKCCRFFFFFFYRFFVVFLSLKYMFVVIIALLCYSWPKIFLWINLVISYYIFSWNLWRLHCKVYGHAVIPVDDHHIAFCKYNGSVARIICVAVAHWNEKLLELASDNDLLLCRKSTSNKTRYKQWFDQCIISNMILKGGSNWLFPVVFSIEITLSGSHDGNSFEFSHRLTGFLN